MMRGDWNVLLPQNMTRNINLHSHTKIDFHTHILFQVGNFLVYWVGDLQNHTHTVYVQSCTSIMHGDRSYTVQVQRVLYSVIRVWF